MQFNNFLGISHIPQLVPFLLTTTHLLSSLSLHSCVCHNSRYISSFPSIIFQTSSWIAGSNPASVHLKY
ncbi:hypothetical protein CW304_09855 [Bacillus sp. UFRGS-B20]|nr:hypothetical protein CW304_09855 [Bacillus sp. UFRGS-B20]